MKNLIFFSLLIGLVSFIQAQAQRQPLQFADILSTQLLEDHTRVLVKASRKDYEYQASFKFPQKVLDYKVSSWWHGLGVAIIARTGCEKEAEYFYSVTEPNFLVYKEVRGNVEPKILKIDVPKDVHPVLGIGPAPGDSLIITAFTNARYDYIKKERLDNEIMAGWIYVAHCPVPGSDYDFGRLTLIPEIVLPQGQPSIAKAKDDSEE